MKHFPQTFSPQQRIESGSIPEPNTGCWLWLGSTNARGYAHLKYQKVQHRANRFSWTAYNGPIANKLHVLHRCDNRLCVNPDHLFLGTNQDNVDDRVSKGRSGRSNALKTNCPVGHEYTKENTYLQKPHNTRSCKICRSIKVKQYNAKRQAKKDN